MGDVPHVEQLADGGGIAADTDQVEHGSTRSAQREQLTLPLLRRSRGAGLVGSHGDAKEAGLEARPLPGDFRQLAQAALQRPLRLSHHIHRQQSRHPQKSRIGVFHQAVTIEGNQAIGAEREDRVELFGPVADDALFDHQLLDGARQLLPLLMQADRCVVERRRQILDLQCG